MYETIVPSALPGKSGTAQGTRDFIGPLTSASSGGRQKVFEQLERARPNWLADLAAQRQQLFEEGMRWLESLAGAALKETAKSAAWVKLSTDAAANNHAAWPDRLTKYLEVVELTKDELSQREHVARQAGVKRVMVHEARGRLIAGLDILARAWL